MNEIKGLVEVLKDLKLSNKEVTVIVKSGGMCDDSSCCSHRGWIGEIVDDCFVVLLQNNNCLRNYIALDRISAIIVSEDKDDCDRDDDRCDRNDEDGYEEDYEDRCDRDDDDIYDEDIYDEDYNDEDDDYKVYGYGRKIRIDFMGRRPMFALTKVNITELVLEIDSSSKNNNFIQYFHKDEVDGRSIELSLLPSSNGGIDAVQCNQATEAVITGTAVVHLNSEDKGECDFELTVTENAVTMNIEYDGEKIEAHSEEVTGICKDNSFTIEKYVNN